MNAADPVLAVTTVGVMFDRTMCRVPSRLSAWGKTQVIDRHSSDTSHIMWVFLASATDCALSEARQCEDEYDNGDHGVQI